MPKLTPFGAVKTQGVKDVDSKASNQEQTSAKRLQSVVKNRDRRSEKDSTTSVLGVALVQLCVS